MREVLFYERQNFNELFYVLALAIGVIGLFIGMPETGGDGSAPLIRLLPGFFMFMVAAVVVNLLTMTTWVYEDEVKVQFGRLFPFYTKRVPIAEISGVCIEDYKPLRESGGWGIRMGRHKGEKTYYLNARGSTGVLLERESTPLIIGTQHPESLEKAIRSIL